MLSPQDTALHAALSSDPRFQVAVAEGTNTPLLEALNAPDPAAKPVRRRVPVAELRQALLVEIDKLTGDDLARFQFLLGGLEEIPLDDPAVLQGLLRWAEPYALIAQAIDDVSRRQPLLAESFGMERVTLEDLARVLPEIPHSHHARYLADQFVKPEDRAENDRVRAARLAAQTAEEATAAGTVRGPHG